MPKPPTQGTQPSLHSFFKRKSPPSSPAKLSANLNGKGKEGTTIQADEGVIDFTASPPLKRIRLASDDDSTIEAIPLPVRKASLAQSSSSYFAKPPSRNRTPLLEKDTQATLAGLPSAVPTPLEAFRFRKPLASSFQPLTASQLQPKTPAELARHEKWQARLLTPGGIIPRRKSLALDEAAAAELRGGIIDGTPEEEEGPEQEDGERVRAAEDVGSKLREKFAAKETGVGKGKGKKKEDVGPSGQTYTPLEKQYMEIKAKWPDVLLMTEVGYKYKFHGEDAKTASKELGIAAFPSRNFYSASIPVHRLHIHVKKLISLGYKVGVVSQMETAALKKVGDNRNAPFTRELTHLYTAATYVEEPSLPSSSTLTDDPLLPGSAPPPTNALLAIVEMGLGGLTTDDRVRIGMVSVIPGTGDVVWDEFEDSPVRTELETRLTHLSPAELLLPANGLSRATEKVLDHFAGSTTTSSSNSVRVERIDKISPYDPAFDYLTRFYKKPAAAKSSREIDLTEDSDEEAGPSEDGDMKEKDEDLLGLAAGLPSEEAVLALVDFPKQVVVALAVAVKYMKDFGLENAFRHRSFFTKFINRAHMLLSSNTLNNLYIASTGSRVSNILISDQKGDIPEPDGWRDLWQSPVVTKTRMGKRLLREWIGRPLLDVKALQARIDAIEEIMECKDYRMEKLRSLLVNMPDLVRGLTRIQYGKATPTEVATILVGLVRVGSEFRPNEGDVFKSALLNSILKILPTVKEPAKAFLEAFNVQSARDDSKADLWNDVDKYPTIQDAKDCIAICESELDAHLKEIRKLLKKPAQKYITVSGIEYLVEIPVRDVKSVPPKWAKISAVKEREQHKEMLNAAATTAFLSFQSDISECHGLVVISKQLAVIDCLMSLAQVAAASGYCKPTFVAQPELHIQDGRHPMVEVLRDEAYVPFDIDFSDETGKAKVITGPNMAGKSSCVRATALIVCMAQIGSFVPASAVTLGLHDAVQTRMGASDEIGRGKSTFMVELSETSDILRTITPRTLVILDELGRGTSTFDGVAIAYATLSHLAGIGCNTLFVTHYPMVAEELAKEFPHQVSNWHMSFDEQSLPDGSAEITFLYRLSRGLAEASFGVWCARLAGLPNSVLQQAQTRADYLKHETRQRLADAMARLTQRLLLDCKDEPRHSASDTLKNLVVLHKALARSVST
ncbi:DNA mismatch repair protein MSH3, partial [Tremellales sp. Uapishka_1]